MRPRPRPLIGVTANILQGTLRVSVRYLAAVEAAGGVPVVIGPSGPGGPEPAELAARLDAFVLTGGRDPRTEPFGEPTHPRARPMEPMRQDFEVGLLRALQEERPGAPVLGVCLGMQLMALVAGGRLNQYMPDDVPTAADHVNDRRHEVSPCNGGLDWLERPGVVASAHRQAVADPGGLRVAGVAHDGVIEAVDDPARPFYLGVQWHPERTVDPAVGRTPFERFIAAAGRRPG